MFDKLSPNDRVKKYMNKYEKIIICLFIWNRKKNVFLFVTILS